jgi:cleavage and polyadenylation specificity factor subunit 1
VTRGNIYLFDVVDVVPQPGKPDTDLKLKLLAKEDVRGAVTSICSIGSQGFLLAAQGQKCMVRGLREDNSILPVAFMDMRYYVHVATSLPGTGLAILGDVFSGLWLVGYSEEPYKLQLLGHDLENPECVAASFLPADKELHIVSSDGDGHLRILQYDPENPKAERGTKLLLRSTFDSGTVPTTMTLLPRTPTSYEAPNQSSSSDRDSDAMAIDTPISPSEQVLITTQEGALALIIPLPEASYRRLSTLQNILLTQLEHPCSLNPRAYRAVETDGVGGRGMIDGELVKRWLHLSSHHKASLADKVGARGVWEVRSDMEMILGRSGLGFLT